MRAADIKQNLSDADIAAIYAAHDIDEAKKLFRDALQRMKEGYSKRNTNPAKIKALQTNLAGMNTLNDVHRLATNTYFVGQGMGVAGSNWQRKFN